jgi:hypothetical protein
MLMKVTMRVALGLSVWALAGAVLVTPAGAQMQPGSSKGLERLAQGCIRLTTRGMRSFQGQRREYLRTHEGWKQRGINWLCPPNVKR